MVPSYDAGVNLKLIGGGGDFIMGFKVTLLVPYVLPGYPPSVGVCMIPLYLQL